MPSAGRRTLWPAAKYLRLGSARARRVRTTCPVRVSVDRKSASDTENSLRNGHPSDEIVRRHTPIVLSRAHELGLDMLQGYHNGLVSQF